MVVYLSFIYAIINGYERDYMILEIQLLFKQKKTLYTRYLSVYTRL